jgi:hypothetical protein
MGCLAMNCIEKFRTRRLKAMDNVLADEEAAEKK